jgi:hypothetical protein
LLPQSLWLLSPINRMGHVFCSNHRHNPLRIVWYVQLKFTCVKTRSYIATQSLGHSVVALTMNRRKTLNDRTGAMFDLCASSLFRTVVVQYDILSESKMVLAGSDLILRRSIRF